VRIGDGPFDCAFQQIGAIDRRNAPTLHPLGVALDTTTLPLRPLSSIVEANRNRETRKRKSMLHPYIDSQTRRESDAPRELEIPHAFTACVGSMKEHRGFLKRSKRGLLLGFFLDLFSS
jgi:hypothetical protein